MAIMNNGYLGMVRQWQELFYEDNYVSVAMTQPDFVKLAEAYGIHGMRVTEKDAGGRRDPRGGRAPGPGAARLPGRGRGERLADGAGGRRAQTVEAPDGGGARSDASPTEWDRIR